MSVHAHLDQAALQELQAVLGADFPVLVQTFVADSEARIATLRTVLAAADHAAVRDAAHSLKGSSLNLGAQQLAELCLQLEQQARHGQTGQAPALLAAIDAEFRLVAQLLTTAARG